MANQTINSDAGTVTAKSVKTGPGTVHAALVTNIGASLRWFQLHNKASIPLATEVPLLWFPIPAGTAAEPGVLVLSSAWLAPNQEHTVGIGWAISSTPSTFTDAATANEHTVQVRVT